jgi:hypothetical protein
MPAAYDPPGTIPGPRCPQTMDLINSLDECVATIRCLSELGPIIDGHDEYFANTVELLSLVLREPGHLEKLSAQTAADVTQLADAIIYGTGGSATLALARLPRALQLLSLRTARVTETLESEGIT